MSYYKRSGQMDLTDRVAIETGLCRGETFREIAERIRRHPKTVAHEVLGNRTHIYAAYFHGIDCRRAKSCNKKGLCGTTTDTCHRPCTHCREYDCRILCSAYESMTLLMNHINSTRRRSLGGKSPYELVDEHDEDMHALFSLLKMDLIPPDEVHLKPDLFTKNR